MTKLIIGLGGPKGAGKTTVANMILEQIPDAERIAFATPLKRMLESVGIPHDCLHGDRKEEPLDVLCGKSARWAMQTLGTEWGRECIGENFWGRLWEQAVDASNAPVIVVDDVRFPNEAERIKRRGGVAVVVLPPLADLPADPLHSSEDWAAIRFDRFLINDKSKGLDVLGAEAERLVTRIALWHDPAPTA